MGLFEDTVVKAKDAFDVAAKKTGEVWSVQKLKFNIAGLNSQLSKDFETLGRIYFDSLDSDADISESVEGIKSEIKDKLSQIAELEAEVAAQKNTVVCQSCGGRNSSEAAYCQKCGNKL